MLKDKITINIYQTFLIYLRNTRSYSILTSTANKVWIAWIIIFLILRLELSFSIIHRFYQNRLLLITQHFPVPQDSKRCMHRAAKVVAEASERGKDRESSLIE